MFNHFFHTYFGIKGLSPKFNPRRCICPTFGRTEMTGAEKGDKLRYTALC
jgi:hypothetical protein